MMSRALVNWTESLGSLGLLHFPVPFAQHPHESCKASWHAQAAPWPRVSGALRRRVHQRIGSCWQSEAPGCSAACLGCISMRGCRAKSCSSRPTQHPGNAQSRKCPGGGSQDHSQVSSVCLRISSHCILSASNSLVVFTSLEQSDRGPAGTQVLADTCPLVTQLHGP